MLDFNQLILLILIFYINLIELEILDIFSILPNQFLHMFLFRAGMGPFSEHVSLSVEPRHVYQHSVLGPELPVPSVETVLQQTWFVSTVGILALFLILSAVALVYVKRKYGNEKTFDHYDGK